MYIFCSIFLLVGIWELDTIQDRQYFHFYLRAAWTHPHEDVLARVQDHDVVVRQVVLAEVGALLRHSEEAL